MWSKILSVITFVGKGQTNNLTCYAPGPLCIGVGEDGAGGEGLVKVRDGLSGVGAVTALTEGHGGPSIYAARRRICDVCCCCCCCFFGRLFLLATDTPHNDQRRDGV